MSADHRWTRALTLARALVQEPNPARLADALVDFAEGEMIGLRDELAWFAQQMERELRDNDWKDHWSTCSQRWLLNRLKQETAELERALTTGREIASEAADVANFAMMIADNARRLREDP
jgi:NTP pyrophosphatase (non-canonical NTP hydrolase)